MKAIELEFSQKKFNGDFTGGTTIPRVWSEDLIEKELDELLNESESIEEASLSGDFPKSEFSIEEVEAIVGLYGEIVEDCENAINVSWAKYSNKQTKID